MAKVGCLLILISMLALCLITVLPVLPFLEDSEAMDNMLQPLLCKSGETIERRQYSTTDSEGTSYSMDVFCQSATGVRREVTTRWFLFGIVGFLAPFLIGLFAVIFGVSRNVKNTAAQALEMAQMGGNAQYFGFDVPVSTVSGMPSQNATLSARLKQIEDARAAGLITSEEYDRLRQEILNDMM